MFRINRYDQQFTFKKNKTYLKFHPRKMKLNRGSRRLFENLTQEALKLN